MIDMMEKLIFLKLVMSLKILILVILIHFELKNLMMMKSTSAT